jgi:transcription elongation factor Elf1
MHPLVKAFKRQAKRTEAREKAEQAAKATCVRCGRPVTGAIAVESAQLLCAACGREMEHVIK